MLKKPSRLIKSIFSFTKITKPDTTVAVGFTVGEMSGTERAFREGELKMATEDLKMHHEALQKSLTLTLVSVIIALLAVLVAITLGVIAIKSKQDIKVEPIINVR